MKFYEIPFSSTHRHIRDILDFYISKCEVMADTFFEKNKIVLSINDTDEDIEKFFAELGKKLPLSIFMKNGNFRETPVSPIVYKNSIKTPKIGINIEELYELFDPESKNYLKHEENIDAESVATSLKNSETIVVGEKSYSLNSNEFSYILVFDNDFFKENTLCSQDELFLINSIEKPIVNLVVRSDASDTLPKKVMPCRLPMSAFEYILASKLKGSGIRAIYCKSSERALKMISEQGRSLIIDGEFLPTLIPATPKSFASIASDYCATEYEDGEVVVDRLTNKKIGAVSTIYLKEGTQLDVAHPNVLHFSDYEGAIFSVALENELLDEKTIAVYLSSKSANSGIYLKNGNDLAKVIGFKESQNMDEIFEQISKDTPVVANYKDRFGYTNSKEPINTLGDLFGAFGSVVEPANTLKEAHEKLSETSQSASLDRSVKIDMKMEQNDTLYTLNSAKTIQSILSFKLADVDSDMLYYAIMESFCDFLNENILELTKRVDTKKVIICGDFFANKMALKRTLKHSNNYYEIFLNRVLPIDGDIMQAVGGAYAKA